MNQGQPGEPAASSAVAAALTDDLERIAIGAVGLTTRVLAEAAPHTDLTFPMWRTLLVVGASPGGARVSTVAARVGVTLPATGRLLRRLEARGLLSLATDTTDRRATLATLTDEGERVRMAILATRRAALLEVAARLPGPAHEDLAAGLNAIADALEAYA